MANIDDFKANLIGGGARANQFRVTITPPPGIAIGLDVRRASFLVKGSNLPASTLGEIAVPFREETFMFLVTDLLQSLGQQLSLMILTSWSEMQWRDGKMELMIMLIILVL